MFHKSILACTLVTAVFLLSGCAGSSGTPPVTGPQVVMKNTAFDPMNLTVKKGETVTWTNKDPVYHTVTSDTGAFDSKNVQAGKTYTYTFNAVGVFPYHCTPHGSPGAGMHATITVTA